MSVDLSVNADMFFNRTVLEPIIQGDGNTGTHGIGVKTPPALAVADATVGLDRLIHIPNGIIFTKGLLSNMVAIGLDVTFTILLGNTFNVDGAFPNGHCNIAPWHTQKLIVVHS